MANKKNKRKMLSLQARRRQLKHNKSNTSQSKSGERVPINIQDDESAETLDKRNMSSLIALQSVDWDNFASKEMTCFAESSDKMRNDLLGQNSTEDMEQAKTEEENNSQPISGRRLIDISYFLTQLQEKSNHIDLFDCKLGSFRLIGEKRKGLMSTFKLQCNICLNIITIESERPHNTENVDINIAATTGIVASGIGYSQFEELFSAMDVPVLSSAYFAQIQDKVYESWETTAADSMKAAAGREKEAAISEGRVKDGIPLIDVFVDGAWCSRSYGNNYRALSGTAAIIGKKFGEVLYMAVKNKYCLICAIAEKKGHDPKEHKCYKNYSGSSSAMEAEIICEGFKSSLEMYGIIYARMIADGDSSTYNKILQAQPYINHTVGKIECRNHILRNFCNKLRALPKDTKYPLAHRKTLTQEKIMSMRKVIVRSIKYHKNSTNCRKVGISMLHRDISNSVAHAYGDHRLCTEYNCTRDKNLLGNTMKSIENSTFLFRIKAIVATTASKSSSLIEDVDTNTVERFNSVIAKYVGGKRINFSLRRGYQGRCSAAVVSYNDESAISSVQKVILGRSPKGKVKEIEKRRVLKRKHNREHPRKKIRKFNDKSTAQHDYGTKSSAPDFSPDQYEIEKEDFLNRLKVLTTDRDMIERTTVLQRDCSEWMDIRKNIITASNFGSICKRKLSLSSAPLVKNILYKKNLSHISSVAHGIENEKQALQQLEAQENIVIEPCGLFIDSKYSFIGASPDGLVGNDAVVEVKCPATAYKNGIENAIKSNKIQIFKFDKKTKTTVLNKNSNWYYQVQGQLHVSGREKCIFGVWSGQDQPLIVEYISRDDDFWYVKMEKKIVDFYLHCLLPEIVDPRHIRGMPVRDIKLQKMKENVPPSLNKTSDTTIQPQNIDTRHNGSIPTGNIRSQKINENVPSCLNELSDTIILPEIADPRDIRGIARDIILQENNENVPPSLNEMSHLNDLMFNDFLRTDYVNCSSTIHNAQETIPGQVQKSSNVCRELQFNEF